MALPKVTLDIKIGAKEIVTLVLGIPWAYKKVQAYKAYYQKRNQPKMDPGKWYINRGFGPGNEVIYGPNGEKYRRER
jgi:hypothetical protein